MDEVDRELRARGREARLELLRLFEHESMQVRLKAATRTLTVAPVRARTVLEAIRASQYHPQALDAGMLIRGLDDGTFKPKTLGERMAEYASRLGESWLAPPRGREGSLHTPNGAG